MNRVFFIVIFAVLPVITLAQQVHILTDSDTAHIQRFETLPDRGYSLQRVRTDTSLPFVKRGVVNPLLATHYWVRTIVYNPSHHTRNYNVSVKPFLDNILYYFEPDNKTWVERRGGIISKSTENELNPLEIPCVFPGHTAQTLYFKIEVAALKKFGFTIRPKILLEKNEVVQSRQNKVSIAWVVGVCVLLVFFLNNLYIYLSLSDKTILYYLIVQLGAIIYITSYWGFFKLILPKKVFSVGVSPPEVIAFYDLNQLCMHIGIVLLMFGLVQLTRSYLSTRKALPVYDKMLQYGLYAYVSVSILLTLINIFVMEVESRTVVYDNIAVFFLIIAIISTCIAGYLRKLPAAATFLLAYILPFACIGGTALFHIFISLSDSDNLVLPDLAIISQALSLSIALVYRTRAIEQDLKVKQAEADHLEFDLREMGLKQRLIELENEKMHTEMQYEKTKNELLQHRLEINQRELASTTMYIVQKNELLTNLKMQIRELNKQYPFGKEQGLKGIKTILHSNLYLDGDWKKFRVHFEQVHPHFFENLLAKYPNLTKNEVRLYAYFHLNLSTKEIASMLNIDPPSVRRAKTRLYKKMAVSEGKLEVKNDD